MQSAQAILDPRYRILQLENFQFGLFRTAVGYHVQVVRPVSHHHIAHRYAGSARPALQKPHLYSIGTGNAVQLALSLRMRNRTGQLSCQREQKGDLLILEFTRLALAHHQYPQHLAVLDDRNAKKSMVGDLSRVGDEQVAGMAGRIIQVERLGTFADQPIRPRCIGRLTLPTAS